MNEGLLCADNHYTAGRGNSERKDFQLNASAPSFTVGSKAWGSGVWGSELNPTAPEFKPRRKNNLSKKCGKSVNNRNNKATKTELVLKPYICSIELGYLKLDINFTLYSNFIKKDTAPKPYKEALGVIMRDYEGYVQIYTDGSQNADDRRLGSAAVNVTERNNKLQALEFVASTNNILRAEFYALFLALKLISESNDRRFLIISDCHNVLDQLTWQYGRNREADMIREGLENLIGNNTIKFLWVPSHRQIEGNEAADHAALRASWHTPEPENYTL